MVIFSQQSSSSSTHDDHIYDVFLSFRGADTRLNFTSHPHKALLNANIATFLDDDDIETGEDLKPSLERAIKASRASILVISKDYASSTWCLDELVLILKQSKIVVPIFYHVEPTDVKKQQNTFGSAMEKHKQRMELEANAEKKSQWAKKMELWSQALTQVGHLKGENAKGRLALCKAVLGGLAVYFFPLYRAPANVINLLEGNRRKFFWGSTNENRKTAWVAWDKILSTRKKGGLGIGSLRAQNLALIAKWWWRFKTEKTLYGEK
ncbi:hypothetical protein OSB04_013178 [Centaurea solstitialis]|uniref:TIR domain-containing protein n=1 Tax=Centaurea solstitialis TaxID=347529 RepID=A0AA38TEI2_9ASTR|nr:hypothetical protein OSB04_013178 [Centaurea solstitialis]